MQRRVASGIHSPLLGRTRDVSVRGENLREGGVFLYVLIFGVGVRW